MTIRVYPSLLPGEPLETHEWTGTFAAWLAACGIDHAGRGVQPVAVTVNGAELLAADWTTTPLCADDAVDVRVIPQFEGIGYVIAAIVAIGVMVLTQPRMPKGGTQQGQQLNSASATANQAKLNGVVPELLGRHRRYPDYLTPPVRRFAGPREQWLEFLACIGPGSYDVEPELIKVGDTPLSLLDDDARITIFGPGASVAGDTAHEHWYSNAEVGGTSSGTAGIELSTDNAPPSRPDAQLFTFDDDTITVPEGMGAFPDAWYIGELLDITLPLSYSVTRTWAGQDVNTFIGNFRECAPVVGMTLVLSGALTGTFNVSSATIDPATGDGEIMLETLGGWDQVPAPVGGLNPGTYSIAFKRAGSQYEVTGLSPDTLTVTRATPAGAWAGFPEVTSSAASIVLDQSELSGEWTNHYVACPDAEQTNTFEVDLFFPQGLGKAGGGGSVGKVSVAVDIQYRDARHGGAYTSVRRTYTDGTLDQIGFTERITLPAPIKPEVRIRRVGAKSTTTDVMDEVQWYGLKSRLGTRSSYPGWTTIAIHIRGGGKLSARSENQINLVATRILPALQAGGAWSAPQPTRDISAAVRYIAATIGYADDSLDIDEFQRLQALWSQRGETVDYVFDETTVREALALCLAAGMSELTVDDGRIRPVRDEPRTVFQHAYSAQNSTGALSRTFTAPRPDDNDGVEVEFIDSADSWVSKTIQCTLPGSPGIKLEKLQANGITDRTRAWRAGMRRAREQRYRRWTYAFSTEMDALCSAYGDYISLVADVPGYGQSAILEAITGNATAATLTVSEPLTWAAGEPHVLALRQPTGALAGPFAATPGPDGYTVIVFGIGPEHWPEVTLEQEPPHVYFGTSTRWTWPALVRQITPKGMTSVDVEAVNYHPDIYADDDNAPPPA